MAQSWAGCAIVPGNTTEGARAETEITDLKKQQKKLHYVSEHLANERTILAWILTAIEVMTLRVGINRFSLFLQEFSHVVPGGRTVNVHTEQLGIGLVVLGQLVMIGSTFHYLHVANAIEKESYQPSRLGIAFTALAVLAVGGTSLVWLLW